MLSMLPHNGQRAEVEDILNLMAFERVGYELPNRQWCLGDRAVWHSLASASYCNSSQSVGVMWLTIASMCGLQRKPVEIVEGIPGIWKCNVRGACECCSVCTGVSPLITNNARVGFNFIEMYGVREVL
eukprot:1143571-Pelagomonas_calceolata.AAC.1